jgi:hypothetical protein
VPPFAERLVRLEHVAGNFSRNSRFSRDSGTGR